MRLNYSAIATTCIAACVGLAAERLGAQTPPVNVQILVYGIHFGGQVAYRYQVRNNSASNIDQVSLGLAAPGKDLPPEPWASHAELGDVPSQVPANECKPFLNMTCSVGLYQFDYMATPRSVINMEAAELSQSPPPATFGTAHVIRPGTVSSIAEVYTPARSPGYLSATGSVRLLDNQPRDANGNPLVLAEVPFTKVDVSPPSLSGSTNVTKIGGMLNVQVNLQARDDYDPSPEIVLVSVTSNEAIHPRDVQAVIGTDTRTLQVKRSKGRLYYLTYRAIDGSENASTLVLTVPGELP